MFSTLCDWTTLMQIINYVKWANIAANVLSYQLCLLYSILQLVFVISF